jgi:hypothetical protein
MHPICSGKLILPPFKSVWLLFNLPDLPDLPLSSALTSLAFARQSVSRRNVEFVLQAIGIAVHTISWLGFNINSHAILVDRNGADDLKTGQCLLEL